MLRKSVINTANFASRSITTQNRGTHLTPKDVSLYEEAFRIAEGAIYNGSESYINEVKESHAKDSHKYGAGFVGKVEHEVARATALATSSDTPTEKRSLCSPLAKIAFLDKGMSEWVNHGQMAKLEEGVLRNKFKEMYEKEFGIHRQV